MSRRQIIGLVGSLLLALGVFLPILSLPIVGSMNYFQNGRGDGTIILVIALLSVLIALRRHYEWLLTTGAASLAMVVVTFVRVAMRLSNIRTEAESKLADNPFRGLADVAMQSVQMQWGWMVLFTGAVLVLVAALVRDASAAMLRKCPFCAELVQPDAKICKHCRSELTPVPMVSPESAQRFPLRVVVCTLLLVVGVPALTWLGPYVTAEQIDSASVGSKPTLVVTVRPGGTGWQITNDSGVEWRKCSFAIAGHAVEVPSLPTNSPLELASVSFSNGGVPQNANITESSVSMSCLSPQGSQARVYLLSAR